ncbi:MAG: DEAD/DEAH box helicase, partial [Paracoccaceae bacterium]
RKGKAYTISLPSDDKYLAAIESLIKEPIPRGALPEGFEHSPTGPMKDAGKSDDKLKKTRSARIRNDSKPKPAAVETQASAAEEATDVVAAPVRRPHNREPRETDRAKRENNSKHTDTQRAPREHYNKNSYGNGPDVFGLGDHVPDFILRSFAISPAPKTANADKTPSQDADEAV